MSLSKKIALSVLGIFITLIAALLIRTLTFTSSQRSVEAVPPVALDEGALAERLGAAIRLETVSSKDASEVDERALEELRAHLIASFPKAHATLSREAVAGASLLYTWEGTDPSLAPIMFLAHQDVVPVEDAAGWTHPPFSGVVADGHVWGRGAMDDKCGVLGILEAVEHLLGEGFRPARTVYLGFGHDEEVGGAGAVAMAALLESRGVELDFLLDEGLMITEGIIPGIDAPVALIGLAEKGYISVELVAELEGGHSSTPAAQTSVGILAKAIHALETQQLEARLDGAALAMFDKLGREMPFFQRLAFANLWLLEPLIVAQLTAKPATNAIVRTTTAPTMFEGGQRDNVLPARARAVVNFRILPGDSTESVLEHVERVVADSRIEVRPLEGLAGEPSAVSDHRSRGYEAIEEATRKVFPEAIVAPALFIAAADARHFSAISRQTFRYMPQRLTPEDRARFHGKDERIAVEDYANLVRFYRQVILESAAGDPSAP